MQYTRCILLDLLASPSKKESQYRYISCNTQIPSSWNGFAYICDGEGTIGDIQAPRENAMVLGKGDMVTASVSAGGYMRFLLICG